MLHRRCTGSEACFLGLDLPHSFNEWCASFRWSGQINTLIAGGSRVLPNNGSVTPQFKEIRTTVVSSSCYTTVRSANDLAIYVIADTAHVAAERAYVVDEVATIGKGHDRLMRVPQWLCFKPFDELHYPRRCFLTCSDFITSDIPWRRQDGKKQSSGQQLYNLWHFFASPTLFHMSEARIEIPLTKCILAPPNLTTRVALWKTDLRGTVRQRHLLSRLVSLVTVLMYHRAVHYSYTFSSAQTQIRI